MPEKKGPSKKKSAVKRIPRRLNLDSVEEETMTRVGRTLGIISDFLARWDATRLKPDAMLPQIMKIRKFHDALERWQRESLRARGKERYDARLRRLRDFVLICQTYS